MVAPKEVVDTGIEGQLKDDVAASWAAVATGKEVGGKGTVDLLFQVRARGYGGRRYVGDGNDDNLEGPTATDRDFTKWVTGESDIASGTTSKGTQRGNSHNREGRLGLIPHIQLQTDRLFHVYSSRCLRWHLRRQGGHRCQASLHTVHEDPGKWRYGIRGVPGPLSFRYYDGEPLVRTS